MLKLPRFQRVTLLQPLRLQNQPEGSVDEPCQPSQSFPEIVGCSSALRRVQREIQAVAPSDTTVLITGETGTGKELVARAIHRLSPRACGPFISLNCAAIPGTLLESELFGYERGAFTGALHQKLGRFEVANGGTLFLDEIGDIPLELQSKLLRALQEKTIERLGATGTIPIDVRVITATNRDLTQMMAERLFRTDLYYRLNVFPIITPPLRARPEDIPALVRFFVKKYSATMRREIHTISGEVMSALVNWHWLGNVRELENFIERSVVLSTGSSLRAPVAQLRLPPASIKASDSSLEHVEREHITRILRECGGSVTDAAVQLGLQRTTLHSMMSKLGINRKDSGYSRAHSY